MADNLPDIQGGLSTVEATPVVLISPAGVAYQTSDGVGQDTANASLASIDAKITALQALVDGLEALAAAATPAGTALIGKVGIDQTTPGTTNGVVVNAVPSASAASVTSVNSSASSAQVLAADAARKGLILQNTDANKVYVKFGTTASASSFTITLEADDIYEMAPPIYTGRIDAIWSVDGSGALLVTEL